MSVKNSVELINDSARLISGLMDVAKEGLHVGNLNNLLKLLRDAKEVYDDAQGAYVELQDGLDAQELILLGETILALLVKIYQGPK